MGQRPQDHPVRQRLEPPHRQNRNPYVPAIQQHDDHGRRDETEQRHADKAEEKTSVENESRIQRFHRSAFF